MTNPWDVDAYVQNIQVDVYLTSTNQKIATLYEDLSSSPIFIPKNSTIVTSPQPAKIAGISIEELEGLVSFLYGRT